MLGVLSIYGYDRVASRLDDLADGSLETMDRNEGRRKIWAANIAAFRNGWLTGAGAGSHREIYPVYLAESPPTEYTHAENGYLQVATELGVGGIALLIACFWLCGSWCYTCLTRLKSGNEQLYFGAIAAGLMAGAVHSLVDFVWYIPACMSVTVVLAACALRLAQLALPNEQATACQRQLTRPRTLELAAVGILAAAWCIHTLFGPAMASIHWDRYLRAAIDKSQAARQQLSELISGQEQLATLDTESLLDSMLRHLECAAYWDRSQSRVQLRLASKYLARFELLQQRAENAMPLFQVREAVLASDFASPAELRAWLQRAVGENVEWLYRAYDHARRAAALCPLEGEAYLHLAKLCFLDCTPRHIAKAYSSQGLLVRPYDADVLFEVGKQNLLAGDLVSAVEYWRRCFRDRGMHQLRIVHALAGPQIPAALFLQEFQPDWWTLQSIWTRYRRAGNPNDLQAIVEYAARVTERQVQEKGGIPPEYIWLWQASMYTDVDRSAEALSCLEHAQRINPHLYAIRSALSRALMNAGRFTEAEPHVRWCLARRPDNKRFKAFLVEINKQRFADGESAGTHLQ
jgi:tetratricopeptide (TPR) repeat protein